MFLKTNEVKRQLQNVQRSLMGCTNIAENGEGKAEKAKEINRLLHKAEGRPGNGNKKRNIGRIRFIIVRRKISKNGKERNEYNSLLSLGYLAFFEHFLPA